MRWSAIKVRARIAGAPVRQVEIGIVGAGHPDGAAAMFPIASAPAIVAGLIRIGNRIEVPGLFAGLGFEGGDEAANAEFASGNAHDHFILDHQRRHGLGIARRQPRPA